MALPQIPLYSGDTPNRTQPQAEFSNNADDWLNYQAPLPASYNALASAINVVSEEIDDNAQLASASAASASAIANYKGIWSSLSGALNVPASVKHNGSFYFLINNLANVALSEPSVTSDWQLIVNVGNIRKSLLDSPLCRLFCPNKLVDTLAGSLTATRASTATYVDRYGVVRTAAIDEMREESEGWLIEGQSTNLLTYSEEFSNWTTSSGTVLNENVINSPNLSLTADGLEVGTSTFPQMVNSSASSDSNTKTTFSVFLKAGVVGFVQMRVRSLSNNSSYYRAIFNLKSGNVIESSIVGFGGGAAESASITSLSDGWHRCSITGVASTEAGTSQAVVILQINETDVATASNSAATDGIFLWGAQLEALPFASSYIPTTTAPATRAADVVSADGVNNIPLLSGNLSVTYIVNRLKFGGGGEPSYTFTASADDSLNLSHSFWNNGDNAIIAYYSGNLFFTTVGNEPQKQITTTYNKTSLITYSDGNLAKSDEVAYTDVSDKAVSLHFGSNHLGDQGLYGHLRDFRIYDFALNADEAQFLAGVK